MVEHSSTTGTCELCFFFLHMKLHWIPLHHLKHLATKNKLFPSLCVMNKWWPPLLFSALASSFTFSLCRPYLLLLGNVNTLCLTNVWWSNSSSLWAFLIVLIVHFLLVHFRLVIGLIKLAFGPTESTICTTKSQWIKGKENMKNWWWWLRQTDRQTDRQN